MREIAVTEKIRLIVRPPEPGEAVPDFPGVAAAAKQAGFFGGTNVMSDILTAATAAGWGRDNAREVVRAAHRADKPPTPPTDAQIDRDVRWTWWLLAVAALVHVPLLLGSFGAGGRYALWPIFGLAVPVLLARCSGAKAVLWSPFAWTFLAVALETWREMAVRRASAGWPFFAVVVIGSIWSFSYLPIKPMVDYEGETSKFLDAVGRAKLGSPGYVIEVWVAEKDGWVRV